MWLPSPMLWLLVGLLSATFPPWGAATAPPRRTEVPGWGAARSSSSNRLGDLLVSQEPGQPMTQRAVSVLVLASAVLIAYFVIRTVRLRRQNRRTQRYGVLDTNIENMQLTPLE